MRIGCAGWNIPKQHMALFSAAGSHLHRYARRFNAVEINSSFYRPHRRATYERWAATVPDDFAFAVKLPKQITHELRLAAAEAALDIFLDQASGLGANSVRSGPAAAKPGIRFRLAHAFFAALRARHAGNVVCEPGMRRGSPPQPTHCWRACDRTAAADPPVGTAPFAPGGWQGLHYYRLHGAPHIYYSEYDAVFLQRLAQTFSERSGARWCIFDNTARGAATTNAVSLQRLVREASNPGR